MNLGGGNILLLQAFSIIDGSLPPFATGGGHGVGGVAVGRGGDGRYRGGGGHQEHFGHPRAED